MKVLIDASNIKAGGGLQVAISFVNYTLENEIDGFEFFYTLSSKVVEQLPLIKNKESIFIVDSDIKTLNPLSKTRKLLNSIVSRTEPDIVYTIFGPPFWSFSGKHVVGFANAWVVTPDTIAYKYINWKKRYLVKLKNFILGKILINENRYYFTETNDIKLKMMRKFSISENNIIVIPNSLPYMYSNSRYMSNPEIKFNRGDCFNVVTIASNYPHKNLDLIPRVAFLLKSWGYDIDFYVTIPEKEYEKKSSFFKENTINFGVLPVDTCAQVYKEADLMFLPTLLECFSVSYLEAMYFSTPICTSDFYFSREVCDEAAIYFDPLDEIDAARSVERLIVSKKLYDSQKEKCQKVMLTHCTNDQRAERYLSELFRIGNKDV